MLRNIGMNSKEETHSDQKYIEGLRLKDGKVVQEIYDRFFHRVERYVSANSGKESDARDIFQEALVAVFQKAQEKTFHLSCPFEAYLLAVCRNLWLNELKKRGRERVTNQDYSLYQDEIEVDALGEETALEHDRDRFFRRKFESLGPACQKVLRLSWGGLSMQETAEKMEVTYGYARKKKSECLERLAQLIRQDPDYEHLKKGI
jgi:RNA polymerase sigma factor (sigma-70 family)